MEGSALLLSAHVLITHLDDSSVRTPPIGLGAHMTGQPEPEHVFPLMCTTLSQNSPFRSFWIVQRLPANHSCAWCMATFFGKKKKLLSEDQTITI